MRTTIPAALLVSHLGSPKRPRAVSHGAGIPLRSRNSAWRDGIPRSVQPGIPMLTLGRRAEWIVEAHDDCLFACGPGSLFAKLPSLDAWIAFFNVSYRTMTFFHCTPTIERA